MIIDNKNPDKMNFNKIKLGNLLFKIFDKNFNKINSFTSCVIENKTG